MNTKRGEVDEREKVDINSFSIYYRLISAGFCKRPKEVYVIK